MEELITILLELLFVYPGAFIRWILFYRKSKTIKETASDDLFMNSLVGVLATGFVIGISYSIIK